MTLERSADTGSGSNLHTIIQELPAAIYSCDGRGMVLDYNRSAATLWGREPEIGKEKWCGSWKIYRTDGSPLPLESCPMAVAISSGKAISGEVIVIEKPDGQKLDVMVYPLPYVDSAGRVTGALNILIDITSLKNVDAGNEVDRVSRLLVHNLQEHVMNMSNLLYLYENFPFDYDEIQRDLQSVSFSLADLMNDLKKIVAIKNGSDVKQEKVQFSGIFNYALARTHTNMNTGGFSIHTNFEKAPSVTADKNYLENLFHQLLTNSIKFQSAGRKLKISVRTEQRRDHVLLHFKDNGIGMDTGRHKEKLFGLYQRFHSGKEGKGLGLYLVKLYAEALGGNAEVHSRPDEGMTVLLRLKKR